MRILFLLFLVFFSFSCSEKTEVKIPENILPREKMISVLLDIHLLEAAMNLNVNPVTAPAMNIQTGSDVFKKNQVAKAQYDESFAFYSLHPELLNEIYQDVLNSLSQMQAEITNGKQ